MGEKLLCLAPVVLLLALLQFVDGDPCTIACGVNADCKLYGSTPVCTCPATMTGDPYIFCSPLEAQGPCTTACGVNADCKLHGSTPVCTCPATMTGDPFTFCRPLEARDLCEPNPCAANAKCTTGYDRSGDEQPLCTCHSGYTGDSLVACNKLGECELDSQCVDHQACVGNKCVDPAAAPK